MLRVSRSLLKSRNLQPKQLRKSSDQPKSTQVQSSKSLKDVPPELPPNKPITSGRKGPGFLTYFVTVTLTGSAGVVAYAWYDPSVRKQIEDNVPYSKEAFDAMIGPSSADQSSSPDQVAKPVTRSSPAVPIASEQEVEAIKKESLMRDKEPKPVTSTETVKKDTQADKELAKKKEIEKMKKQDEEKKKLEKERKKREEDRKKEELERKKQEERNRIEKAKQDKLAEEAAENAALESILAYARKEADEVVVMAKEAQTAAAETIKKHSHLLKNAMDSSGETDGTDGQWEAVTVAHKLRVEATEKAEQLGEQAKLSLEKLKVAIEEGKTNVLTKRNEHLREAEATLKQAKYDFENSAAEVSKAVSESKIMKEYRDLIKKGKEQFKQELESVLPEVKIKQGWDYYPGGKMSEEDLNSLIAHAHRRIEQLQKQLAEQQALEAQRTEKALIRQKEEDDKLAKSRVEREKEKLKSEFEIEKLTWDTQAKIKAEEEIRQQLARQAAAHSDHLAEVLKLQQRDLEAHYDVLVQDQLLQARAVFNQEIAGHIARLKGIEAAVEGRAELEKKGRKAQELWLACQTLANVIEQPSDFQSGGESEKTKPLANEVMAINEAGDNHVFVKNITQSFPEEALMKGVSTEESINERFRKVSRICRRVAMVDETNKTLFRYMLSYIQSLFVFTQVKPFTESDEIDLESLSSFVILDNAKFQMEKGNLIQALQFMNMLKGEARSVASDWIKDTRLLIITKQAGDALLAHASASGLGSLH